MTGAQASQEPLSIADRRVIRQDKLERKLVSSNHLQDVALGNLLHGAAAAAAAGAASLGGAGLDGGRSLLGLSRGGSTTGGDDDGGEGRGRSLLGNIITGLVLGARGGLGGGGAGGGGGLGGGGGGRSSGGRSSGGRSCGGRSCGGRGRGRGLGGAGVGARPDSGTGDLVASIASVEVEDNTLVSIGVILVEVEGLIGDGAAGAGDLDLDARGVELSTTGRVGVVGVIGLVVSDDLLADQILASLETGGKIEVNLAVVGLELVNSPLGAIVAGLLDLGPDGASAIILGVGGDVGDDGTLVGAVDDVVVTVVVVPLEGEGVTGSSLYELGGGLATVDVADEIGAGEVLDGAVVGRGSDVDALAVTLVLAVDPSAVHEGVSGDGGGHSHSGSDGETHLDIDRGICVRGCVFFLFVVIGIG